MFSRLIAFSVCRACGILLQVQNLRLIGYLSPTLVVHDVFHLRGRFATVPPLRWMLALLSVGTLRVVLTFKARDLCM